MASWMALIWLVGAAVMHILGADLAIVFANIALSQAWLLADHITKERR